MRYRRLRTGGGTYFFTVVTYERKGLLCDPVNVQLLREAFQRVRLKRPFLVEAFVLLPDHLHCIWTMPEGDFDYPTRWRLIKSHFAKRCENNGVVLISDSRLKKEERGIWQRRFWEHMIRDQQDFNRHIEYIHFNPVKHGYVSAPKEWRYSTFHQFVKAGIYDVDFGVSNDVPFDGVTGME